MKVHQFDFTAPHPRLLCGAADPYLVMVRVIDDLTKYPFKARQCKRCKRIIKARRAKGMK